MPVLLTRSLLLALSLVCCRLTAISQPTNAKMIFIVDSFLVLHDPEPGDELHQGDIAETKVIRNKDSLLKLGYAGYAGVTYIYTKAYRTRPDSLRNIPSTRQMSRVNSVWLLHGTAYTGPTIDYYSNGIKRMETWMIRGQTEGPQVLYYPTGQLMQRQDYHLGTIDGIDKQFYPDGSLLHQGVFTNGKQNGVWEFYYPNGQVKIHTAFSQGQRTDSVLRYYSNGRLHPNEPEPTTIHEASLAIRKDSLNAEAWYVRGTLQMGSSHFDKAIADLDKALAIEPYLELAHVNRALARVGKYKTPIPPEEKQKVCDDLQKAIFLGYRVKTMYGWLRDYCQ